jgi:hypothetical protein
MRRRTTFLATAIAALLTAPVLAQNLDERFVDRNANQQERILEGLQRGMLTVREAGDLERQAARVARLEHEALLRGRISREERQAIRAGLREVSERIREAMQNEHTSPWRTESQDVMMRLVQRNVNQARRIEQGLRSGELTDREAARLLGGQARIYRRQADAAADEFIDRAELASIRDLERRQSGRIFRQKHDRQDETG